LQRGTAGVKWGESFGRNPDGQPTFPKEESTMINTTKKKPIRVETGGTAGAFFEVPVSQLDDVRRLLDAHRFRYSVYDRYLSFNGGPEQALVHLGWGGDAIAVQKILDDAD
jgi:hypothetical protein